MGVKRINFKTYISNGSFHIPLYQRNFVWKSRQALDFIDEIIELHKYYRDSERGIFCGTTYLKSNNENTWDVIDGQQRTTFIYGIKWALEGIIKDLKKKLGEFNSKRDENLIDEFKKLSSKIEHFEITTARCKKEDSFENQITSGEGKIINIYNDIKSRIEGYINSELKNINIDIIEFIIFIFNRVELIEVKVEEKDDINDIFKSINSKGKSLTTWDIIRNDIYRKSDSNETILENIDNELSVLEQEYNIKNEEFIRGYLMSKCKKYVPKSKILLFFNEFNQSKNPEEIKTDVEKFSEDLNKFNSDVKNNNVNFIKHFFRVTKELGQVQVRTFSVALLLSWGLENEVPVSIKKLLVNSVIFSKIGKGRANIFEKFFQKHTKEILEDKGKLEELIELSEFKKDNIRILKMPELRESIDENRSLLKLVLWLKTPKSEFTSVMKALHFEYEHVLPKKFDKWLNEYPDWKKIETEIKSKYLNKLGNIILIHKSLNAKIQDSIFENKVEWYTEPKINNKENEHYIFTRNLSLKNDLEFLKGLYDIQKDLIWNTELINERTSKILDLIIETLKENY